jgi:hypothetical protein
MQRRVKSLRSVMHDGESDFTAAKCSGSQILLLHHATGSQILLLQHAAGSERKKFKDACCSGSQFLPLHNSAGCQFGSEESSLKILEDFLGSERDNHVKNHYPIPAIIMY